MKCIVIRIALCEDEEEQQNILKSHLKKIFNELDYEYEVCSFNSGEELMENYPQDIDIFLLDIYMDKITGIEVAKNIRKIDQNCEIIFITFLNDHVREGYKVRASRYLLKPVSIIELKKHLISCIEKIIESKNTDLVVFEEDNVYKISINSILYTKIIRNDMIIHTLKRDFKIKSKISNIEKELLKHSFIKCKKNYIINLKYICAAKENTIELINGEKIPFNMKNSKDLQEKIINMTY
ncbi:LytTR family DNA-binding domain-containing protein [Clostridioides mangenotii]|uniref:LytR/AlgR family response regulator transcription factor n=1 Tax=Metaclostridioides mangenotii TaxID=1540 RepID=UPI001C1012F1|nr:LytTR family DNA-binding domain-containing protein [Clostridioides mangenotii]MCR1955557.1 LytTR family DNA-binding domain-containing protein [Clostridioides mangenotii]